MKAPIISVVLLLLAFIAIFLGKPHPDEMLPDPLADDSVCIATRILGFKITKSP